MKVLIGTKNPGKIEGATRAFKHFFDDVTIEGVFVNSDVADEPVNKDIYIGARNRVNNLIDYSKRENIDADYFIGVESGITNLLGKYIIVNIAVIKDHNGYESWGTSPGFPVPDRYVRDIIHTDLGKVMDDLFKQHDLRSGNGGISFLTKNVITRIDQVDQAFTMALTQFINDDIWKD